MIAGGPGSAAAGIEPFPEPPKGSSSEIHAAARGLRSAAQELEAAHGTLASASGMLGAWQGQASLAYHGCAQALARVLHGGVESLHTCAGTVSSYAGALDRAQSGMRRLRPLYDAAVRQAQREAALVGQLAGALSNANKSQAGKLRGLIRGADVGAGDAVSEANGYARAAQRLLDDFRREASQYASVLEPVDAQMFGGQLGAPIGTPGSGFGVGQSVGGFGSALAPLSGVIPLQLPSSQHGDSLFGEVLKGIGTVASVVSTVGGACSALLFWNGVGEVCGTVAAGASGVGALDGVVEAATGHGSVEHAIVGVGEAIPGGVSYNLDKSAGTLLENAAATGDHVLANGAALRKGIASGIDGVGATAASRGIVEGFRSQSSGVPAGTSPGAIDQAAGRGIEQQLAGIDNALTDPASLLAHR